MTFDFSYEPGPVPQVVLRQEHGHRTLETWSMQGSGGGPVMVDVHLPERVDRVVLMGHGADNSRRARYIEVSGKSFTRRGTVVVAMDAPRHGERPDAAPLEALPGLIPEVLEEWVRDHRRLLDALEDRWPGIPIGFAGFSMGALYGVPLVSVDRRSAALAVIIAGSTLHSYPGRVSLSEEDLAVLAATDPAAHAAGVGSRPVLVLAADRDELVPRRSALALYDSFTGPREIVFMPGTHTEWGLAARWFRRLEGFFLEALG